jgi:hypothetical protein
VFNSTLDNESEDKDDTSAGTIDGFNSLSKEGSGKNFGDESSNRVFVLSETEMKLMHG